jgi:hypothetical protein
MEYLTLRALHDEICKFAAFGTPNIPGQGAAASLGRAYKFISQPAQNVFTKNVGTPLTLQAKAPKLLAAGRNATLAGSQQLGASWEHFQKTQPHLAKEIHTHPLVAQHGMPPAMAYSLLHMSKAPGQSFIDSAVQHGVVTPNPVGTVAAVPQRKMAEQSKEALFERLVRLGATDIPNTPRLLMRHRSPEELRALQQSVEHGWDSRVTHPLMNVAEKGLKKLPEGKLQSFARKGAKLVAEDPIGNIATQFSPIPGTHPAYLAGKKTLEKLIDRHLTV